MNRNALIKIDEIVKAARISGYRSPDEWYTAFVQEYHKLPKIEQRDGHIFLKVARKVSGIGRSKPE